MNYYNYPMNPTFNVPQYNNSGNLYYVGSEEEAKSWIVNPNQTVYLLDRNNAKLYVKSVEKNGMAQPLEIFELSVPKTNEEQKIEYATKKDIEDLKVKIKEIENEHTSNGTASAE